MESRDKTKLIKVVLAVYFLLAGSYCVYAIATESGLYGWVIDLQLRFIGTAHTNISVLLTVLVLLIPTMPLSAYVKRQALIAKQTAKSGAGGPQVQTKKTPQWVWLVVAGLAPLVISLVAYAYVTIVDINNQKQKIYQLDLSKSAELPSSDAKFIELTSVLQQDFEYAIDEGSTGSKTRYSYIPLTGPDWNPDQPVKYLLYLKSSGGQRLSIGHIDKKTGRYDVMPPKGPFPSTFDGQLSKIGLPSYVSSAFERRGIKIADQHYVLEWMGDFNGSIHSQYSSQMYYLIPVLGAFVSLITLVFGGLSLVARNRRLQKLSPKPGQQ